MWGEGTFGAAINEQNRFHDNHNAHAILGILWNDEELLCKLGNVQNVEQLCKLEDYAN